MIMTDETPTREDLELERDHLNDCLNRCRARQVEFRTKLAAEMDSEPKLMLAIWSTEKKMRGVS